MVENNNKIKHKNSSTIVAMRVAALNPEVCPKACSFLNLLCSFRIIFFNLCVILICSGSTQSGAHFYEKKTFKLTNEMKKIFY